MDNMNLNDIREKLDASQGKQLWQSLEELADTEGFDELIEKEFPSHIAPLEHSVDRRNFIKLLGASLAFGGLTACARPIKPNHKIVPYVKQPEEIVPGKPLFYATAITQGGYALGLLAESHQGRPTKLEGNPDHPASLGATDATTQAAVLNLYDPERSQSIRARTGERSEERNWTDFTSALTQATGGLDGGAGLYILTETVTSPTLAKQLSDVITEYPSAQWHQFDALHTDSARDGANLAFGETLTTYYDLSKADVVVSLGADIFGEGPAKLRYSKDFARRRRLLTAEEGMNRLYLLETTPGLTSPLADHKLSLTPSQIGSYAVAIAQALGVNAEGGAGTEVDSAFVTALVEDLKGAGSAGVVIAGETLPAELHALVHAINGALGNVGETVVYTEPVEANPVNQLESLTELSSAMIDGQVQALVILGGNPAYTAPAGLNFAEGLERVPFSAHLSEDFNETSAVTNWHVPAANFLETWGDARAFDGTVSITQPLIGSFFDGSKSAHEVVAALLGNPEGSAYDTVREFWQGQIDGDFNAFWRQSVYQGVVEGSQAPIKEVSLAQVLPALPAASSGGFEIVFKHDPSIQDGRYANNGWLQELPKPISKLTWDNAAFMSVSDAQERGIKTNDVIAVTANGSSVSLPVFILPGQAKGAITAYLGFGRENAGRIASGVGVNVYPLRGANALWSAPAELSRMEGSYKLISTQNHQRMEGTMERRHIIRHGTLAEFEAHPEHPEFVHPVEHVESDLYPAYEYDTYAWGMVIDMTVCTGCNACVTSCQAENNIPIVGKDQVEVGREMHWIRVDTYYGGDLDNPDYYIQPLACMHCEQAPCEPVCPVGATVHDNEGLNVMVYNRCVGTRYCSNNCPYKVRRYNFLQYAELTTTATELSLAQNPDVTVRSRGVMEKCTFCTQRIQQAYITSENERRRIRDGEVVTACQAACPTEAIVFGDIGQDSSIVSRYKGSALNYSLLEELNTKPRLTYLAKLKNPNPALAGDESGVHS